MTPLPPSPSDGPTRPPSHRPSAENLAKDNTERDLWELDELMADDQEPARISQIEPIRRDQPYDPPKPQSAANILPKPIQPVPVLTARSHVMRRVTAADRARLSQDGTQGTDEVPSSAPNRGRVEATFDELEHWDNTGPDRPVAVLEDVFDELPDRPSSSRNVAVSDSPEPVVDPGPDLPSPAPVPPALAADLADEFSAKPLKKEHAKSLLRFHLELKFYEKIGLLALAILLIGSGVWVYLGTLSRISGGAPDPISLLPARGNHVTITKVETYWRTPVTTGDKQETVRRGVVLIPVAEITATGKGAIRVLFSNDRGADVGDPTIREINGDTSLVIPATAGFDDTGSHAAYQAGLTKDWHVKIAEADAANAAGNAFKPVSKIAVKPTLR